MIIRSALVTLALLLTPAVASAGKVSLQGRSEQQLVVLLNQIRAEHHLPALTYNPHLRTAARAHSLDMFRRGSFTHDSRAESSHARIKRYLDTAKNSENIGWGIGLAGTPIGLAYQWMHSARHRSVILDPRMRQVGVGIAAGPFKGKRNTVLATADFAS